MKIVCATNMPYVAEAFSTLGDAIVLEGRRITAAAVRDCELLALRSTTKVDAALLRGSRVRFVGTATIGTDHMDIDWLQANGIHWCSAPGCNANSVSEYVTAALLCLSRRHGIGLEGLTMGIIGVGNVGRCVAPKAAALGMRVLLNDPPRERAGEAAAAGFKFYPLDRLLAESDVLTVHVPLTDSGCDATRHLVDEVFFKRARRGLIFINAARGAVVKTAALLAALEDGRVAHAVVDTWEGEPRISRELLAKVDIGTPHIAGHSFEGRVEGTMMVYRQACRFLGGDPLWDVEPHLPEPEVPELDFRCLGSAANEEAVGRSVRAVYDLERDDRCFREASSGTAEAAEAAFDELRRNYPRRREFRFTRVVLPSGFSTATAGRLRRLGFRVAGC